MNKIITSSFVAIIAGICTAICILLFTSNEPFFALIAFFTGSFSSTYYLGNWLNMTALLSFAALGIALSQKSGNLNLGGEGQIYFSGFMTALILPFFVSFSPIVALFLVAIIVCFITGLIGAFSGFLKVYRRSNELLTSFLFSAALIPLIDHGVNVFKDQSKNLLAMQLIPENLRLSLYLRPSHFNVSFFLVPIAVLLIAWFLYKTREGYIFRINGTAPEFGYFSGFSPAKTSILGLFFSAVLHGLTGFFAVVGTYYTCYTGFYSGLGWNALTACLIARSNPLAVFPSCLLMAYLLTSANYVSLTNNLAIDATGIISAAMLVCVSGQFVFRKQRGGSNG